MNRNRIIAGLGIFIFIFILYFTIYVFFIYPLYNLSTVQTKDEMYNTAKLILLASSDSRLLNQINNKNNDISFYYNYFVFTSNKYTIWLLFHKHNKFTKNGNIVLYHYNHETRTSNCEKLYIDFNKYRTYLSNGKVVIEYLNNYRHEIDFDTNKMKLHVNTGKNKLVVNLLIDEYNTTFPALLSRYQIIKTSVTLSETNSLNEWANDNPLIGKLLNGSFNGDSIENNSNFWYDYMIGCNNFFVSEYYWFIILTDDWLIYILFYGKYENINSNDMCIPLFIKDRKNNKILHCCPGVVPSIYKPIENMMRPIKVNYSSNPNKHVGDSMFDDYQLTFESNEISINMKSIPNQSARVLFYDYYNDPMLDKSSIPEGWDNKYKNVLDNLMYVEYVNKVDVEIHYNNNVEKFKCDQIIDSVCINDKSKPSTIKFNE